MACRTEAARKVERSEEAKSTWEEQEGKVLNGLAHEDPLIRQRPRHHFLKRPRTTAVSASARDGNTTDFSEQQHIARGFRYGPRTDITVCFPVL
jgi:hypothetical protein